MNKKKFCLIAISTLVLTSLLAVPSAMSDEEVTSRMDINTIYYPNANLKSAISKYKNGNYSGCLQELFSLTKKDPSNAVAYYYMAMAYTHVDMQTEAVAAYEKVLTLSPNSYIADLATKGKDCLTGGPTCKSEETGDTQDELDKFINAPYGNGMSDELNNEVKQKQLKNIQETINSKEDLEHKDLERIREFDQNNKSSIEENEKIAMVSDDEILNAVKTLKEAGVNVTIQPDSSYQNSQMTEMSMLLGNSNNNNSMSNMLPMLMNQAQQGENVDPRFMQAMMMNSMMADFNFNDNNNNR